MGYILQMPEIRARTVDVCIDVLKVFNDLPSKFSETAKVLFLFFFVSSKASTLRADGVGEMISKKWVGFTGAVGLCYLC